MLTNKLTRTTITIPEDLLFEIKKQALVERKSMKDIIVEKMRYDSQGKNQKKDLTLLADAFVGAGKWKKTHPLWKDKKHVNRWLKDLRAEWES